MCGIFAFITRDEALSAFEIHRMTNDMLRISESRGKEAAGAAVCSAKQIRVFRRATAASAMIQTAAYQSFMNAALADAPACVAVMGHSRLVTNGDSAHLENNQPVVKGDTVCVHNGIIVNTADLQKAHPEIELVSEVDTEMYASLVDEYAANASVTEAITKAYREIYGMASTLTCVAGTDCLVAATNNGSLYYCIAQNQRSIVLMSEKQGILRLLKRNAAARALFSAERITHLEPDKGVLVALKEFAVVPFSFASSGDVPHAHGHKGGFPIQVDQGNAATERMPQTQVCTTSYARFEIDTAPIRELRRCTRCVLPETMPFIEFDEEGVCNYCRTYSKHTYLGKDALHERVKALRKPAGQADSVVAFSGGRDSCYGLHYFVKELGLNPVAFTYDWGMVTDLARRNQSRLCAKLGVELIVISADIRKKRENIRKNVSAWLKKPDLGLVPLFMAGDKQYFYYANQVRKRNDLPTILLASNPFEETHFKSGFCGVKPAPLRQRENWKEIEKIGFDGVMRLTGYYLKQYIGNPAYINASLLDTIGAVISYYAIPHHYFRLYNYIPWDERTVDQTLLDAYDWELSPDAETTWRIGDGTAPFYNYIYYFAAGFSEHDTLRSNQIREGALTREEALELVYRDNQPRFDSMQWYFDAIGMDMQDVLSRVRKMPQRYK